MKYSGVYWMGHVYDMGGYGNVSRNYLKALEAAGIPVYIYPIGEAHSEIGSGTKQWIEQLSTSQIGSNPVFVLHTLPSLFHVVKPPIPHAAKKIGITLFETDRLPFGWGAFCNKMDEIWVPSSFNHQTFHHSGVVLSKLQIVPYAIDVTKFYPGRPFTKFPFPISDHTFKFTYVFGFDFRKGYDLLIESFCEAFSPQEELSLILKVYIYSEHTPEYVLNEIRSHIPEERFQRQIAVIIESFSQDQLLDFYLSSDVYVSMDRACGWGMPLMEAMTLGLPTISIRWGGPTEFMNDGNSFLIEPEGGLVPVEEKLQYSRPEVYLNHQWADVSVQNVAKVLREAYENKTKREAVAKQAAYDMHTKFAPHVIGTKIKNLLGRS
ncbi:glycosyltransferase [Paenibacillus larvae]